jgi:hypothetical protein
MTGKDDGDIVERMRVDHDAQAAPPVDRAQQSAQQCAQQEVRPVPDLAPDAGRLMMREAEQERTQHGGDERGRAGGGAEAAPKRENQPAHQPEAEQQLFEDAGTDRDRQLGADVRDRERHRQHRDHVERRRPKRRLEEHPRVHAGQVPPLVARAIDRETEQCQDSEIERDLPDPLESVKQLLVDRRRAVARPGIGDQARLVQREQRHDEDVAGRQRPADGEVVRRLARAQAFVPKWTAAMPNESG